ncbi:hypothetical protein JoomaDRAFT_3314 [Galbibacter orientalis DSM 19592]|uniref:Uncharacterized protein n=1 Tax=Galbibacter orientalis DSM 19592 TaxID=926559 RepID=I3C9G6_9FLAO|nr:hypothetical protein [Galbibacter orientalis]EIJ40259.1 hypothetical protein JoomaDRAFT_3314 [Galbibacter orientalis DSM 19592]
MAGHSFTAIQTSAYIDNKNLFQDFAIVTFKCGLTIKDITNDSLLNNYIKNKRLDKYLLKKYIKYNKVFANQINTTLRDSLYALTKIDHKWKVYYLYSLSKVDSNNAKKYEIVYDSIVSKIVENRLIPLIKKYGYPGERNIGLCRNGAQNDSYKYRYSFSNVTARTILLHYYMQPKPCTYNNMFLNEVKKGNMPPNQYASIMDFQARFGTDASCNAEIYNEITDTKDTTLFNQINRRRKELGLESLEEKHSKYKRGQVACKEIKRKKYNHIKLFYWCR